MTPNTGGLVAEPAIFFERHWKRAPYLGTVAGGPAGMPTAGDLLDLVDCGLLTHHYFTVVENGERVPASAFTRTREVLNSKIVGIADGAAVSARHADGATILLHEPDQWHAGIHALVRSVAAGLDGTVRATAVLIPAGGSISWPADPDTQRFLITLSGAASCAETTGAVAAGQVLYLPHSQACTMRAASGGTLLLMIAVRETTPAEIARTLIERFIDDRLTSTADEPARVRSDLMAFLREVDGAGESRP